MAQVASNQSSAATASSAPSPTAPIDDKKASAPWATSSEKGSSFALPQAASPPRRQAAWVSPIGSGSTGVVLPTPKGTSTADGTELWRPLSSLSSRRAWLLSAPCAPVSCPVWFAKDGRKPNSPAASQHSKRLHNQRWVTQNYITWMARSRGGGEGHRTIS